MFITDVYNKYHIRGSYKKDLDGHELLDFFHDINPGPRGVARVERVISEISGMWKLTKVKISDISFNDECVRGKESQRLVKRYSENRDEMPPVILDEITTYRNGKFEAGGYEIIDGFHRIAAAKKRGESSVMAYVPVG